MTPAFRYMGGKVRTRDWLVGNFPRSGRKYLEPFSGLGNVYYLAKNELFFDTYHLNDINPFLQSLKRLPIASIPDEMTEGRFQILSYTDSDLSRVLEPRITYGGKGYANGYNHHGYKGYRYRANCTVAQNLLKDALITNDKWNNLRYDLLDKNDFVYFDPPYMGTKAQYPNIDHKRLVELINTLPCKWAVSGYENSLYDEKLNHKTKVTFSRTADMKHTSGGGQAVEHLWRNY